MKPSNESGRRKYTFYYLVRDDNKQIFELGTGNWEFIVPKLFDKNLLLEQIVTIASIEDWLVRPAYLLWLRDEIFDFASNSEDIRLENEQFGKFSAPTGYKISKTRYSLNHEYIQHVHRFYNNCE